MAKIMNNMNPQKNPFTSILGIVFLVLGLGAIVAPTFGIEVKMEAWLVYAFILGGAGLLLIPDDLKGALSKIVNKKADSI